MTTKDHSLATEFHRKTPPDPGSGRSRRAWPRGCIAGSGTSTGRTRGSSLADFANSATSSAGMSPSPPGKTPGVVPVPVFRSRPVRRSRSLRWTLRMHRQFRRLRPRQARILLRAGRRYCPTWPTIWPRPEKRLEPECLPESPLSGVSLRAAGLRPAGRSHGDHAAVRGVGRYGCVARRPRRLRRQRFHATSGWGHTALRRRSFCCPNGMAPRRRALSARCSMPDAHAH